MTDQDVGFAMEGYGELCVGSFEVEGFLVQSGTLPATKTAAKATIVQEPSVVANSSLSR